MKLFFSGHANERMIERRIPPEIVRHIVQTGQIVIDYPEDRPYPSRLLLGWEGIRPIHVVSAKDNDTDSEYIITVYEPDPSQWQDGFTKRRTP